MAWLCVGIWVYLKIDGLKDMLLFVLLTYVLGSVASPSILNQTHIVLHVSFRLRSHNIFWDMYD